MKHTKEEILNALKVIRDECEGVWCDKCPFGRRENNLVYECALRHTLPDEWDIAEEEPETWRAFK
jgi:hypothetical protein